MFDFVDRDDLFMSFMDLFLQNLLVKPCNFFKISLLKSTILATTWSNIPASLLETLASSKPKQISEVINNDKVLCQSQN